MSQMDTAVAETGASAAVRWIVLLTGTKATEDYEPAASLGEPAALVKEVTDIGVAFHPHTEIRLFPTDRDVFLFWKAKSSGDWIITRVALAPNPQGVRTSLEYISLVLSDAELASIGYNPFQTDTLGLHDQVRGQFLAQKREPITATLSAARNAKTAASSQPALSDDKLSTRENTEVLRAFCAAKRTSAPPTFATWWASGGNAPAGYFDILLQAAPPKVLTLRDAGDVSVALAAELKASLPSPPVGDTVAAEMASRLLTGADNVTAAIAGAASRINDDGADQFRDRLTEASRSATQVAADLTGFGSRLGAGTPESARLGDWITRYQALAGELPKVRHPNPFAARNAAAASGATMARSGGTGAAPASGGSKYAIASVAALGVVGLIAFAATQFAGGNKTNQSANNGGKGAGGGGAMTKAVSSPALSTTPKVPVAVVDPAVAILTSGQQAALGPAKKQAQEAVRKAARASKTTPSDPEVEAITLEAVKSGYKKTLTPADYKASFAGASPWTYARLQETLPALVPAVHEAAVVSAAEAKAAQNLLAAQKEGDAKAAKAAAAAAEVRATPRPDPTAEPTPREASVRRRNSDTGNEARAATPRPEKPTPTRIARRDPEPAAEKLRPKKVKSDKTASKPTVRSAPKAGSADSTGL